MCVATMCCLSYSPSVGKKSKKQFAVYESDIPVTLKSGQGHQTWYEFLNPEQGYNHTKFEGLLLNCLPKSKQSFCHIRKHLSPLRQ